MSTDANTGEVKFYKLYVLICIMISSLVKRVLLYNNIILITAEVLRFLVHQCVLSFCSYFQYGLMLHVCQIEASTIF